MGAGIKTHPKTTAISVDSTGGTSYAAIGELVSVNPEDKKRGTAKTTTMDSSNTYNELIKGWKTGGVIKIMLRYVAANHATLETIFEDDTSTIPNWKVTFPLVGSQVTASTVVFLGVLTGLGVSQGSSEEDKAYESELEITITGKPVFTAGS